jgi:riboflavin biosynthesis pyrimidine reductase
VLSAFARKKLIDELQLFISPKIFGAGKKIFDNFDAHHINNALNFKTRSIMKSGDDLHLIALKY